MHQVLHHYTDSGESPSEHSYINILWCCGWFGEHSVRSGKWSLQ